MKILILSLFLILVSVRGNQDINDLKIVWPLDFCTIQDAVQGFFTGTEEDPSVANSRWVIYFPTLQEKLNTVVSGINTTLIIPTHFFAWLQEVVTLINRYSLWQNYWTFATMFTQLDNTVQTPEGLISLVYKFVLNQAKFQEQIAIFTENFKAGNCFEMSLGAGGVFSALFQFNVPEDII